MKPHENKTGKTVDRQVGEEFSYLIRQLMYDRMSPGYEVPFERDTSFLHIHSIFSPVVHELTRTKIIDNSCALT